MKIKLRLVSILKFLCALIIFWFLFLLISYIGRNNSGDIALILFGGVMIQKDETAPDIISILRWNIIEFIPVLVTLMGFDFECGRKSLTFLRSRSVWRWYFDKILVIILFHYAYIAVGLLAEMLVYSDRTMLHNILILMPLHALSVALCCLTAHIAWGHMRLAIAVYFLINGVTAAMGIMDNALNKFAYSYFGMVNRSSYVNEQFGFNTKIAVFTMILVILINISAQAIYLKKERLATINF